MKRMYLVTSTSILIGMLSWYQSSLAQSNVKEKQTKEDLTKEIIQVGESVAFLGVGSYGFFFLTTVGSGLTDGILHKDDTAVINRLNTLNHSRLLIMESTDIPDADKLRLTLSIKESLFTEFSDLAKRNRFRGDLSKLPANVGALIKEVDRSRPGTLNKLFQFSNKAQVASVMLLMGGMLIAFSADNIADFMQTNDVDPKMIFSQFSDTELFQISEMLVVQFQRANSQKYLLE